MRLSTLLLILLLGIIDGELLLSPLYDHYVLGMSYPGIWEMWAETDKMILALTLAGWHGVSIYAWKALRAIEDGKV